MPKASEPMLYLDYQVDTHDVSQIPEWTAREIASTTCCWSTRRFRRLDLISGWMFAKAEGGGGVCLENEKISLLEKDGGKKNVSVVIRCRGVK